jgi:hypothetical protein
LRSVIRPSGSLTDDELASADFDGLLEVALRSGLLTVAAVRC